MPRIAVFTKNRTNPAYEAARLGADRTAARLGATTIHYVPEKPDSVPEQIALIARAIAERPDAAVFVPVDETAVNDAILGFDARRHSAVQHHHPHHGGPARSPSSAPTTGRWPETSRAICSASFAPQHDHHPRRHARLRHQPRTAAGLPGRAGRASRPSTCEARCAAITSATSPATCFCAPGISGRAWTPCCAPTTSWRSACWMRSMRTRAADRWWSASTPSPRRSPPSRRGGCSPPPTSTPWR